MEWCRMSTLGCVVICVVLLWCDLTVADLGLMSSRNYKLRELLKSLNAYSTEVHTVIPVAVNYSAKVEPFPTVPPVLKIPEQSRIGDSDSLLDSVPGSSSVKSYQDFYKTFYGTQEGVSYLRKQFGPTGLREARAKFGISRNLEDMKLANEHLLKMYNKARCRVPVPQVVRVKDFYPDPSREYMPRCTMLHRCSDSTGCCDSEAFHCVPSAVQEVTLHFYALRVGKHGLSHGGHNSFEKLLFVNHTACKCQLINDLPRLQDGSSDPLAGHEPKPKSKCRECPVPFSSRIYKDGRCGCDCFDRQKPCIKIKRGKEPLSSIERRCVEANQCHIPDCEYGMFNSATGYCPKRHDEDHRRPSRRPSQQVPPNHRWTFLERD
ncbi:uncharacterized protein LOC129217400 [Uloborus diversus]|uniref:uncharacterized protein LOC129217400 n=1 Tax=Uloborus diversus TaxID=327109 RepID=UPI00240A496A|nr:uncharacterized protein LOC129217400 [Uloborus diversus]